MGAQQVVEVEMVTPAAVLAAARERRRIADQAEADLCRLAVDWAVMHPADSIHEPATYVVPGCGQTDLELAGPGAPSIAEYAVPELAAALGLSTDAGRRYLGECLELRYRLPRLWTRLTSGDLPAWKARIVARETTRLSQEAAAYVDRHVAPVAHKIGPTQLDRMVDEAIGRFMPEEVQRLAAASWDQPHVTLYDQLVSYTGTMTLEAELDIADALDLEAALRAGAQQRAEMGSHESLDVRRAQALGDLARGQSPLDLPGPSPRALPRQVVMHVHLTDAALAGADPVARLERGHILITAEQVRSWCGRSDTHVVVKPVLDLDTCSFVPSALDTGRIPDRIKDHVDVRDRTCVFPWCTRPARRCDHDHVIPHHRGGPTCTCNLAALCRRHHRLKTHSAWRYTVVDPGTYVWTSPYGYHYLRDTTGTLDVTPTPSQAPEP
jgi:hypothetical protein